MEKKMSSVDNLIKKALSTSSEEEAISALRLARKRHEGKGTFVKEDSNNSSDGHSHLYEEMLARLDYTVAQQDIDIAGHNAVCRYMDKLVQKWQIAFGVVSSVALVLIGVLAWAW
jgi:hypothetical protein